jgi:threonine 3-dehydrogenase
MAKMQDDTMMAAVTTAPKPRSMTMKEVPRPEPGPSDVLIRVKVTSICGTDVHIFNWDEWAQRRIHPPLIQGHEFAGEVVAVGRDTHSTQVGDYVSAEGHITCGHCYQCRTGQGHVCQTVKILGVDRDGSFAEYISVPEVNIWKNDDDLPLEYASIQDPFGNAVHTVFEADVPSRSVAVFGLGPIGLMTIALCKAVGASQVIAVGHKNLYRVDLAKRLGADLVFRAGDPIVDSLLEATDGGVDTVLEMSGSPEALNQGLKAVRPGGGVYLLGTFKQPVTMDLSKDVVFKGVKVKGITGRRMFDTWYRMRGLFRSKALDLRPVITHRLPFKEMVKGMEVMAQGDCGKVVLFLED